jgi:ribosomal-protein-alanine N-acetyltransferase
MYFTLPESLAEYRERLRLSSEKKKAGLEYGYAILYGGKLVGRVGLRIDYHRQLEAELNYFIAEEYWGRGIATEAVRQAEKIAFGKLGIERLVILVEPGNVASVKVAVKSGYKREGKLRYPVPERKKRCADLLLYAKLKEGI